eukprot:TRINITY_DN13856_c0_g2_i7.p1 TRINITY_DN13856_c0_g2~~TRINITY_DN13856_c0_g2_i7.p1  ORF type:complete len:1078 (+),score=355.30 TRINITY_DN13856_c0_g2_i7:75-3236(+)
MREQAELPSNYEVEVLTSPVPEPVAEELIAFLQAAPDGGGETASSDLAERLRSAGGGGLWTVCREGGRVVAHLSISYDPGQKQPVGLLCRVLTHPDHRRRGLAKVCLREALALFDRADGVAVVAWVPDMAGAALCTPFGFELVNGTLGQSAVLLRCPGPKALWGRDLALGDGVGPAACSAPRGYDCRPLRRTDWASAVLLLNAALGENKMVPLSIGSGETAVLALLHAFDSQDKGLLRMACSVGRRTGRLFALAVTVGGAEAVGYAVPGEDQQLAGGGGQALSAALVFLRQPTLPTVARGPPVHVCVRARPLTGAERTLRTMVALRAAPQGDDGAAGVDLSLDPALHGAPPQQQRGQGQGLRFHADFCIGLPGASQDPASALHAVVHAADQVVQQGRDIAIVACGAAGSGKTHALFGGVGGHLGAFLLPLQGLLDRCRGELDDDCVSNILQVRAVELCDGKVNDLLADRTGWPAELPRGGEAPRGHMVLTVCYERRWRAHSASDVWELSDCCELHAAELCPHEDPATVGTLLAKAEIEEGRPDSGAARRVRLREGEAINNALQALAGCLNAGRGRRREADLPEQLTQLLCGAIRWGHVLVLGCVSPSTAKVGETEATLRYLSSITADTGEAQYYRPPPELLSASQSLTSGILGREYAVALRWMEEARAGSHKVLDGLQELHEIKGQDVIITCFQEAKRAYALRTGAAVFDLVDADGDGVLSSQELAAHLQKLGELRDELIEQYAKRASRDWALLLQRIDINDDGTVCAAEFAEYFTKAGLGDAAEAAALFDRIDVNHNDHITVTEIRQHLEANPALLQRIVEANKKTVTAGWDALLSSVQSGKGSRLSRDSFAELWASSGLGRAPEGLGHGSALVSPRVEPGSPGTLPKLMSGGFKSPPCSPVAPLPAAAKQDWTPRAGAPASLSKAQYARLLAAQQLELEERDRSMEDYRKMLQEMQDFNERVFQAICMQYERVLEARVVDRFRRASYMPPRGGDGAKRIATRIRASVAGQSPGCIGDRQTSTGPYLTPTARSPTRVQVRECAVPLALPAPA